MRSSTIAAVSASPRVHAELKEQGVHCGRKRVARLRRERGINAKVRRRKVKTTERQQDKPVAPKFAAPRDFTADAPHSTWVADITGMGTAEGWFYLAAMVDISWRLVVGWATRLARDEELITKAAEMALSQRKPGAGLVHPSERGRRVYESRLAGRAQSS